MSYYGVTVKCANPRCVEWNIKYNVPANNHPCEKCQQPRVLATAVELQPFNDVPKVTEEQPRTVRLECKPSDSEVILQVLGSSNLVQHINVTPIAVQVMSIHEHEIYLLAVKLKTKQQLKDEAAAPDPIMEAHLCRKCRNPHMFCECEPLDSTG